MGEKPLDAAVPNFRRGKSKIQEMFLGIKREKNIFMKTATQKVLCAAALVMIVAAVSTSAFGQALTSSPAQTIALTATLAEKLTVNLSGAAVNFTPLTAGSATNAGNTTITATTAWVLNPTRTAVKVYAYFATTTALTDGTNNIPTSAFFISDNGGASTAVTQNNSAAGFGVAGSSLLLGTTNITAANRNSNRTDAMAFNIDLSGGALPQLPASTYTGTLSIQAQATP
jgi:hypothetical protein